MELSKEEEEQLLDRLSREKAVELLPVSVYVFVMMVVGLCGNVLVCVFYCTKGRETPTTRLIVVVAAIDSIICVLMPKNIVDLSLSYKFTSSALCKMNNFVNHTTAVSSVFVLLAIAAFRFRAVCKPFSTQFSLRHANIAIVIAVAVATAFSVPVLVTHESVPFNISVTSNLTIVGYDCNTSKKPSLKPLNLAVNVLHFFILAASTVSFLVLYGKMGINIMKYYKTKKVLTGESITSVRSTSDQTSKSEIDSGCYMEDNIREKKNPFGGISSAETSGKATNTTHGHPSVPANESRLADKEDGAQITISLKELEKMKERATEKENTEEETWTDDVDGDANEVRDAKHILVTFDKDCKSSDDHSKENVSRPGTVDANKIPIVAIKQTAMLCIITVIFVASFLPYIAMNISRTLSKNKDGDDDFTNWIQFCTRSYLINSATNPFVYGLFNSEFRQYVKHVFCRCCRNS